MAKPAPKLGEILVKEGLLSEDVLKEAVKIQAKEGGRLGDVLLRRKMVKESDLVAALAKQLAIPNYSNVISNGV